MLHLDASIPAALAHTRRRASLLSVSDDRARAAMNRRTGSRGGMRRGGGGVPVDAAEAAINAVSGLVVNLDARDLSAGAITHWFDRKYGYDFAGTATRNAAINGQPTVSGNGTTDILTSTAAISQISGSQAVTVVAVMQDTFVAAATGIPLDYGSGVAGTFLISIAPADSKMYGSCTGNAGQTYAAFVETLASPHVLSFVMDMSLPAATECATIRRDGAAVATTPGGPNNTGTYASNTLSLLSRIGSLYWSGSIAKLLIYSRALTAGEMQQIERACGLLTGILVA